MAAAVLSPSQLASLDPDVIEYLDAVIADEDAAGAEDAAELIATHLDGEVDLAAVTARITAHRNSGAAASAAVTAAASAPVSARAAGGGRRSRRDRRAREEPAEAVALPTAAPAASEAEPADAATMQLLAAEAGDPEALRDLGKRGLPEASGAEALEPLAPGAPPEVLARCLSLFGGDIGRCGEWLLEVMALPVGPAAALGATTAADPAAAAAGTAGAGTVAAVAARPGAGAGIAGALDARSLGEPGGEDSLVAAHDAALQSIGAREAARMRAARVAAERAAGVRKRVVERFDEMAERPTQANKKMTANEARREAKRNRARKGERVLRFVNGRSVMVKSGARFVET
ncbi:hypothetical protein FNF31_01652 [Cafeteria roenbergensis]|uniref:Uncharacterized protein n=1 Tax=Cafeteria roenbergensis TaxID=33653 RepID=A0A5A8DLL4_CAFRO|nr:hypothetical protein FNF31_01652 [Cafeteria roenbergensis]